MRKGYSKNGQRSRVGIPTKDHVILSVQCPGNVSASEPQCELTPHCGMPLLFLQTQRMPLL